MEPVNGDSNEEIWVRAYADYNSDKPPTIEVVKGNVYFRKNFSKVMFPSPSSPDARECWKYDEHVVPEETFLGGLSSKKDTEFILNNVIDLASQVSELSDRAVELANTVLGLSNKVVELENKLKTTEPTPEPEPETKPETTN